MKNSELARRLLGAACLVTVAACASVPSPSPSAAPALAADASVTPDPARAQALRMQADTLERNAEQRFLHEEAGCYDRFLVNRCLDQARERRLADVREARALNIEARRIERAVNLAELEALNAQRAADGRPPLGDGFEPGEPFDSVPAPSADVTTKIPPVPATPPPCACVRSAKPPCAKPNVRKQRSRHSAMPLRPRAVPRKPQRLPCEQKRPSNGVHVTTSAFASASLNALPKPRRPGSPRRRRDASAGAPGGGR